MELEPQRRDALSGQSCELSVAKANEVDAIGNAEVGGDSTSQSEVRLSAERKRKVRDFGASCWLCRPKSEVAQQGDDTLPRAPSGAPRASNTLV